MVDATEEFIRLYEALKTEINQRAGDPEAYDLRLDRAAHRDGIVRRNKTRLHYIKEVRNLLQHPRNARPVRPFTISEGFLRETTALLEAIRNPPTAQDFGVSRSELTVARPEDRIGDLAVMMKRNGFSHLPILDARGAVIGVFNEAAVFAHLWAEEETIIGRGMRVQEIMHCCRLDAGHTEAFDFVGPRTTQDALIDEFLAISDNTRIGAIFVTASGKRTEPVQRMITPWDVLAQINEDQDE